MCADLLAQYQADISSDMDSIGVEVQTDAVMVLSFLCEDYMHIKVMHNSTMKHFGVAAAWYLCVLLAAACILSVVRCLVGCVCFHTQELFGESNGIEVLIHYLQMDIKKFGSGLGHQRLLVAVVDCIW